MSQCACSGATKCVQADYAYPFLAHADDSSRRTALLMSSADGSVEIWAPTQNPAAGRALVANTSGISEGRGSPCTSTAGRWRLRAAAQNDYMVEAAMISQHGRASGQAVWNAARTSSTIHMALAGFHFFEAGLDAQGESRSHFATTS